MTAIAARRATLADVDDVIELLEANLHARLTEAQRADGFLTTAWDRSMLADAVNVPGCIVAHAGGDLVGFILLGTLAFYRRFGVTARLLERLEHASFAGAPIHDAATVFYGPACVRAAERGGGVLETLYAVMQRELAPRYRRGVTFVSSVNPRSLAAHVRKLGMTPIDEFQFNTGTYHTLAFELPPPPGAA